MVYFRRGVGLCTEMIEEEDTTLVDGLCGKGIWSIL